MSRACPALARLRPLVNRFGRLLTIDWREIERDDAVFDRCSRLLVRIGRMMPTIRSLVSIPAGLFGMRPMPFALWSTRGTVGWTGALATAGYMLGRDRADIDAYLRPATILVVVLLAGWYLFRVASWKPRRG